MIIVCQTCSARLQIDDAKKPARPFTVRCPKCNSSVGPDTASPAFEKSALEVGGSPSTERPRTEPEVPAPLFELNPSTITPQAAPETEQVMRLLSGLLQNASSADNSSGARPSWSRRRALVCTSEEHRETIARRLSDNNYQVFVAQDARQAVERMRENQMDVVLLDPQFDLVEQGAAFVMREVNVLRPAQRRRLFFVLLSPSLRTMDAHSAFLSNVNATVNLLELEDLPKFLDSGLRAFNELYKDLNGVLKLTAL